MFATFLISMVVLGLVFTGMALGVIFSNKPIKGSCGGLGALGLKGDCEICGGNADRCESLNDKDAIPGGGKRAAALGHDVLSDKRDL